MVPEPAIRTMEPEMAERERSPLTVPVDARLRSWVIRYEGFDEVSLPRGRAVFPATLVTQLAVKVQDSPFPPVLVNGLNGTFTCIEGPWTPAIAVHVHPLGAYKLLGPALSEIDGPLVDLEHIMGADTRRLSDQVRSARTWEERGRFVDHFLLERAAHGPQPSPEVTRAWQLLLSSGGRTTISAIANQVGWSHKHLITKFKQQIGLTPHLAARLLRLSTVWRHIGDDQSWARIAAESGYADQPHLIREFRRFTGTTPGALAARTTTT